MEDIKVLKEICNKIENNSNSVFGVCNSCVRIVIDYYDSDACECYGCGEYYCSECAPDNIDALGYCGCMKH